MPAPEPRSRAWRWCAGLLAALALAGCDGGSPMGGEDPPGGQRNPASERIPVSGLGAVPNRFTSELWVHGDVAYTGSWGAARAGRASGNVLHVWNVRGAVPVLLDSLAIGRDSVTTLGDVQVSDNNLLVVATEPAPFGSIRIFDVSDPARPRPISTYSAGNAANGVHTAEVARVNGTLYAFLSIDPRAGSRSRLIVVDLSNPAAPREVLDREMGEPFIHDVFVRSGFLFTALWNGGLTIWDIGGRGQGSPANPVQIGNVRTVGGQVHNVWWYHAPGGERRYAFVGQEGPGSIGTGASGDIHVVDVSDMAQPREVAFFRVPGAGTHNFSMDEERGVLYAAYYNGGVRALNVRGDLGSCTAAQRSPDGRCDLGLMGREVGQGLVDFSSPIYVWGVQRVGSALYASDMLNGLFKLDITRLRN